MSKRENNIQNVPKANSYQLNNPIAVRDCFPIACNDKLAQFFLFCTSLLLTKKKVCFFDASTQAYGFMLLNIFWYSSYF
jgi:hypothetical protein